MSERPLPEKIELVLNALELTAQKLADELRITPEWLSKIRRGKTTGSDDIDLRLAELLRRRGIEPTSFFTPASLQAAEAPQKKDETRRYVAPIIAGPQAAGHGASRLQSAFQSSAAEPTEQQCIDYVLRYIGKARQTPGGLGHMWVELHKRFPMEQLAAVREPEEKEK